ncbi:hypothetical protein QJQ45_023196 [Haematococcus lacustris]|nr:hypothetical protein QJQ45_023196 [Haematococcus lacustris]
MLATGGAICGPLDVRSPSGCDNASAHSSRTGDHAASSTSTTSTLPSQYSWTFDNSSQQGSSSSSRRSNQIIQDIPVAAIKRPLGKTRANDPAKVEALMQSIQDIGLQEPIDILEVDGQYYGFSGAASSSPSPPSLMPLAALHPSDVPMTGMAHGMGAATDLKLIKGWVGRPSAAGCGKPRGRC